MVQPGEDQSRQPIEIVNKEVRVLTVSEQKQAEIG